MRFRGHLLGGLACGVLVAEIAAQTGQIGPDNGSAWLGIGCTALGASLLPDLDTSSVPQRWYFRGVFVVLIALAVTQRFRWATALAVISMLPLLDHHRGWTHSRWVPLVVPLVLGEAYALAAAPEATAGLAVLRQTWTGLSGNLVYVLAATAGWYVHLLLDGMFSFLPADPHNH